MGSLLRRRSSEVIAAVIFILIAFAPSVVFDKRSMTTLTGRKAHLLEDKQIPSVGVFDEYVEAVSPSVIDAVTTASPNGKNGGISNIPVSNHYDVLDEESEEEVENVFNESLNLLSSAKTGASSIYKGSAG
ncbi:hypothetical protein Tco_1155426 [Tanacetum coccineum]